jgi:hypothetical protein
MPWGRVAHGARHQGGLFGRVDHGQQQGLRANVEVLLDEGHIALHGPHDGVHGVGGDGAKLLQHGAHVVGGVLTVEQQPVEAASGQGLGRVGVGQADPAADLCISRLERGFEGVVGNVHHGNGGAFGSQNQNR